MIKHKFKNKGFSLIETLVAVGIFSVGIVAVISLMSYIIGISSVARDRVMAVGLAEEGVEIVRNIRDNNWLSGISWDSGLLACSSGCSVSYNSGILGSFQNDYLKYEDGSGYQYNAGGESKFKRKITIENVTDGVELRIVSTVSWNDKGRDYEVSAETLLFNWMPE